MKVALYDRLPIDDLDAYRQLADIVLCSRFRPHTKVAPDADLVLQTWTRAPRITTQPVVSLCGGCRRHVGHLTGTTVYAAPSWQHHDVVAWTVRHVQEMAWRHQPVITVGQGRIGSRVTRALRRDGWTVHALHRDDQLTMAHLADDLSAGGVVSMHLADTPDAAGWLVPDFRWRDVIVLNSARPEQVRDTAMLRALERGTVAAYVVDGGPAWTHPRVGWTPRTAWRGHRSPILRPRSVLAVLRAAAAGQLDQLRVISEPDLTLDMLR